MAVAPTLINTYSSDYAPNTSTKTVSVTTQAGDTVIIAGAIENGTSSFSTPSGNGITFTRKRLDTDSSAGTSVSAIWSGVDSTGGSNWTLSVSATGSAQAFGFTCYVFRNSNGLGVSNGANVISNGIATISLTCSANSAVVVMDADWNGSSSGVPAHTWATVNGITPTSGNGEIATYASSNYIVYTGYYRDTGSGGAANFGLSSPSQRYSISALEVLGGSAPTGTVTAWLRA